jgi:S-formylglutathione hydrolase FrmB
MASATKYIYRIFEKNVLINTMMRYSFFFVKLALILYNLFGYSSGDIPNFVSAFGLTVCSSTQLSNQLYEVVVSSDEVLGNQTIRILVPQNYSTSGNNHRYPVLYLLHGATGDATSWTGAAQDITGNVSLISVMPNGGRFGFYTNWVIPGSLAPQNWRNFHMEQLVPWIDFNLRTVANKKGRAIAGLSMGGYGAIHYAELYSNNFIYAASFSGALDLLDPLVQNIILHLTTIDDKPLVGPFGYPSDPLSSNGWFAQDTITRAAQLRDIHIALYNGNNDYTDSTYLPGCYRLRDLLVLFNIPVYFDDYGDGKSIGYGCDGKHDWACWRASLIDVLPRMMAVLQQQ